MRYRLGSRSPGRGRATAHVARIESPHRSVRAARLLYLSSLAGTLSVMVGLHEALAATDGLRQASRPPNLREARGTERCGNCIWFRPTGAMSGAGACRLYASWPVHRDDISDAYKAKGM